MDHLLTNGIISGQTAFKIYEIICNNCNQKLEFLDLRDIDQIHIKLDPMTFNNIRDGYFNHLYKIKQISNCKLRVTTKIQQKFEYFLYKEMPGTIIKYVSLNLMINSTLLNVKIEDITSVQLDTLLSPLINLRKCYDINEALMNWSLNNNFINFQTYIDHKQLLYGENSIINQINLISNISWFLECKNIIKFVPKKFIRKVSFLHRKTNRDVNPFGHMGPNDLGAWVIGSEKVKKLFIDFMDILSDINKHFVKMVRKYHRTEQISQISSYNLNFPIELYGNKEDIFHPTRRKSLFLVRKNNDHLHLKSFAILFNLRWFFNTRYNSKKSLGFDGEYGRTINGYGQTFHKYDDVLLWLITHPNTIEDVEFVVLDPIPSNYIF